MNDTYLRHLRGMIQIPTISYTDPSKIDFDAFDRFHKYLEETYPLLHATLKKTVIGRAGLLYKWSGTPSDKLPVLLMAHQDVVSPGDDSKWTHPPFSGEIADGYIWGRGSSDCKCVILSEMETIESLIREGFSPDYDIYLAYGYNEEVQTPVKSAREIVSCLKSQNVRLGCVFDEGSGIQSGEPLGYDGFICQAELAEKAYQDYEIYKDCPGGHSMEPGPGTALGSVARAIAAIEEHPLPYRLTPLVRAQLKSLSSSMTGKAAEIYRFPEKNWDTLCALARNDKKLDSLLHTTCAVTMASGSPQSNILPQHASAVMNCRVLQGDTSQSLLEYFRRILPSDVKIRKISGEEPQPASSVTSRPFRMIEEIAKKLYGEKTLMIPALLAGGTDSKYYSEICDNVFRFTGHFRDGQWGPAHGIDERIPCSGIDSAVKFYSEFLLQY